MRIREGLKVSDRGLLRAKFLGKRLETGRDRESINSLRLLEGRRLWLRPALPDPCRAAAVRMGTRFVYCG